MRRFFRNTLIYALITGWVFSGWPQVPFTNVPQKIQEARAGELIAYKSAGAGAMTETSGANLNVVAPATVDANDILIAHVVYLDNATGPSTPSGWTLLFGPSGLGTGTPTGRAWAFGKIADGSEDGATIDFGTAGGTTGRMGRIYSFSGYVSGSITDVVPSASFAENSSETDPVIQSVTTSISGAKAVALVSQDDNNSHAGLGAVTGGTWVESVADYADANVGAQGGKLQIQVGTPTSDPGTIAGGTVAGTDDEANTLNFEIRSNVPPTIALTGTVTASITEADIVAGGKTIILTATGGTYVPAAGVEPGSTIAYKSAGAGLATEANGTDLAPVAPATVDAGDILIAHIVVLDASSALSTPSGWTLLFGPSGLGTGTPTGRAWAYGRIADGSEDGAAINFGSLASTVGRMGRIYSFSGYVSGSITDVVPSASFAENSSETDPVIQSVTTSISGAKAVALVSQDDNNSHAGLGAVTGGTWVESVADYVDTAVGAQGGKLQIQVGTPTADPGAIAGGTVAGTDDEANTLNFEIRSNASVATTPFADARQAIIDGLDSAQAEGTGWDAVVKAGQAVTGVVRTSDTVVTITLDAFASYNITAQETITATIPATALQDGIAVVASPTFTIDTASSPVYSVSITSSGVITYGFVQIGNATSTVNNGYAQTAENDGNTTEQLNVKSSDATGGTTWTLASSIGTNIFKHEFSTSTGATWTTLPDSATYVTAAPTVAQSGTVNFDFRLTAPSQTTDFLQKSITITVQAVAPS